MMVVRKSSTPVWAYLAMLVLLILTGLFAFLWLTSGTDTDDSSSKTVPKDGTVLVNYWTHSSARATAILHVLYAGKGKYGHKEFTADHVVDQTLGTVHPAGGHGWAKGEGRDDEIARGKVALQMSPPVLIDQTDSTKGFMISQTAAILNYLGRKYNMYPTGELNQARAEQYILDQQDFFGSMSKGQGGTVKDRADRRKKQKELEAFVAEDGKLKLWLGTMNRQIQGPFYFGDEPTYVDFALVGVLAAFEGFHRETIKVIGDPVKEYSKVAGIRSKLMQGSPNGYSYRKVKKLCSGATWKDKYTVQQEVARILE